MADLPDPNVDPAHDIDPAKFWHDAYIGALAALSLRKAWVKWSTRAMAALAAGGLLVAVAAVVLAAVVISVVSPLKHNVDVSTTQLIKIANGSNPAGITSRRARAETRFILCSRSTTVIDPKKQLDLKFTCDGYQSLAQAYRTEHVSPPG